ncbi:hypothetical protein HK104_000335 [Borealophlyctis nickersoniae]|nr:hypothetical protein HK104_000335 [Borealophlyctis nickersoniae]
MELGLRCSNRRDGHISYVIENWIVQKKTGTLYVDYPMTHKDLNRAYDEGLCFLHLDYKYWPNTGNTTVVIDEAMSSVFKLSRKPRLIPLPLANATDLTPKERVLTLQLRNMSPEELHGESEEATEDEMVEDTEKAVGKEEKGPAVVGKAAAGNRAVTLRKPFVKEYAYTGVSLWPEDDPDWSIDEVVSPWTVMFWVGAVVGVMVLREHWLVRRTTDRVTQAVYQWWTADIEDPLVPRKGARRRSIFRSNVPDHTA